MRLPTVALNLVALAGCVGHAPMSDHYAGPIDLPIAIVDRFDAEPGAAVAPGFGTNEEGRRGGLGFAVRNVTLPSNVAPGESIEFEYYDVDGEQPTPVVVVLPIFNGQPIVTRYFARYFAHQGWAALALDRRRDPLDHLTQPEQAIRDNLLEYRQVLDWVAGQSGHDQRGIGLFGISFGAVDAVMLTAVDDRVDALVAAMAGGDLAYLFMNTSYRRVSRTVAGLLEETGLTRAGLQDALDDRIATDPLTLAPYIDAARVLMIMTRNDSIVPFEAQQALRRSIGTPEALYLPTGHRTSILYFPMLRSSAYDFFTRRFTAALPLRD
jgi:dienelactone hydrolase